MVACSMSSSLIAMSRKTYRQIHGNVGGVTLQLSYQGSLFGLPLTAVVGADYSGARLDHRIAEREGNDADDEMETRTLAHEEPDRFEPATKVRTYTHGGGAFLTATLQPLERLAVTASARVDVTDLKLKDRLAEKDDELSASGSHRFTRVDPAVGVTYTLTPRLNLYTGYSQSYRAPTAIELTCANPEAPCPIPTAIVDDPPLIRSRAKPGKPVCAGPCFSCAGDARILPYRFKR